MYIVQLRKTTRFLKWIRIVQKSKTIKLLEQTNLVHNSKKKKYIYIYIFELRPETKRLASSETSKQNPQKRGTKQKYLKRHRMTGTNSVG